jgi:hypothetical protein
MPTEFPLLDVQDALHDVATILEDCCREVAMLQTDSDGHYPPEAEAFTANVTALLELLGAVMPEAFREAVAAEQTLMDEEAARWEPSNY